MSAVAAAPDGASRTLSIRGLKKSYVAGQIVLDGIDLDVGGAGIVAIIGPSGAGKSTLIRCINRLVEPSVGEIRLGDTNLARLSGRELRLARRRIGMVFQEYNLVERLTVMENVLCGRLGYVSPVSAFFRRYPDADVREAFALLDDVGLGAKYAVRADNLSGGQRQRVGIARALIQHPDLLLADEPTSSLDPKTSVEIMELIGALTEPRGIPVLINMHDVELARRFAKRIVGMAGGRVVFDGVPSALTNDDLSRIYGGEDWL